MASVNPYVQIDDFSDDFLKGLERFTRMDYAAAARYFELAVKHAPSHQAYRNKYISFEGLARVYIGDKRAVELCRDAAAAECVDGDVFYNLAMAELRTQSRGRAITAIEMGLEVEPDHPKLLRLSRRLDRRRAVLPFLARNNILNRCLGRLMYRRAAVRPI